MTEVQLTFEFHGPFRIATGEPRAGLATTVDRNRLLPPSAVKGLMRSCARDLLRLDSDVIAEVFGGDDQRGRRTSTPWHWGSPVFDTEPQVETRSRIAIDGDTGTAAPGAFFLNEEVWASTARMRLSLKQALAAPDQARHRTVLSCAAAGVHSFGADRRRGLGWVTIRPDPPVDESTLSDLDGLRELAAPTAHKGEVHG